MMNRILVSLVFMVFTCVLHAKIANYNHFPTLQPSHVLDEQLTDISFAFSMRVLVSEYDGPLVRLRRASDGAEQDFGWGDNDIVDIDAINIWRSGSNVFIRTWYDQSGLGRNAIQTTNNRQPRFYPDTQKPYFKGDGVNDYLTVDTPNGIQDVTNNGNQGTVMSVLNATTKSQHTFGVLTGSNRWSTHVNWNNNNFYFDPGICCNNNRYFNNASNVNVWAQYTMVKTSTNVVMRNNATPKVNGTHTTGICTRTEDFAIGWAAGDQSLYATTSFLELIMYKIDINPTQYQEIEENTMMFWSI